MKARLLGPDAREWHSFLDSVRHDFYHLPGYVELSAKRDGGRAAALWVDDERGQMLLPLVIRPIGLDGVDASSPYGYPGPLASRPDDAPFIGEALAAGLPALAEAGIVSCFVRLHPLLNPVPPAGPWTIVRHGDTVGIDLSQPEETLWRETRHDHRSHIRAAERARYVARIDAAMAHLPTFQRLYQATMRRVGASAFYLFDDAYFRQLRDVLGDRLHLWLVEAEGHVAAAGLFVETSGIVQYHLSATDESFARLAPNKLMLHAVRAWARERGDAWLLLGGGVGAADDSLFRFKAGFSSLRFPFHTLRIVVRPAAYAELLRERAPSASAATASDWFPAYRLPPPGGAAGQHSSPFG
jgi:hypothetical protein